MPCVLGQFLPVHCSKKNAYWRDRNTTKDHSASTIVGLPILIGTNSTVLGSCHVNPGFLVARRHVLRTVRAVPIACAECAYRFHLAT
jgi:hypothetical protein